MTASRTEFCAFVLLTLLSLSTGKPYGRVSRSIVKDYFNPLTYATEALKFEKGDDGEYHVHKLPKPVDSTVEYAIAHSVDENNEIFGKSSQPPDHEETSEVEGAKKEKAVSDASYVETSKEELEKEVKGPDRKLLETGKDKKEVLIQSEKKDGLEILSTPEIETKADSGIESLEIGKEIVNKESEAKSDIPVDSKWSLVPKPDGKDDKPFEGGESPDGPEEYLPEPPLNPDKTEDDGKLYIGQFPKLHPVFMPANFPMLVPKQLLFRALPFPPAVHISDRLPLPEAEVLEESSETAVIESPDAHSPVTIKSGSRFVSNHFINPLRFGLPLPFMPMEKVMKEAVDGEKLKGFAESEILDLNGRKMLLQRKIFRSPSTDSSHMRVSVMSVQPLEDLDPVILKDAGKEKKELESEEVRKEAEPKQKETDSLENPETKKKAMDEGDKAIILKDETGIQKEVEESTVVKQVPGPEMLELGESKIDEKHGVISKDLPLGTVVPEIKNIYKDEKIEATLAASKVSEVESKEKNVDAAKSVGLAGVATADIDDKLNENKPEKDIIETTMGTQEKRKEIPKEMLEVGESKVDEKYGVIAKDLPLGTVVPEIKEFGKDEKIEVTLTANKKTEGDSKVKNAVAGKSEEMAGVATVTNDDKLNENKPEKEIIETTVETEAKKKEITEKTTAAANEVKHDIVETKYALSPRSQIKSHHHIVDGYSSTDALAMDLLKNESKAEDDEKTQTEVLEDTVTPIERTKALEVKTEVKKEEVKSGIEKVTFDSHIARENEAKKDVKEKTNIKDLQLSERKDANSKELDLTKTEGMLLVEREKDLEESEEKEMKKGKSKVSKKKKKCKCETSDDSDSDGEDE